MLVWSFKIDKMALKYIFCSVICPGTTCPGMTRHAGTKSLQSCGALILGYGGSIIKCILYIR